MAQNYFSDLLKPLKTQNMRFLLDKTTDDQNVFHPKSYLDDILIPSKKIKYLKESIQEEEYDNFSIYSEINHPPIHQKFENIEKNSVFKIQKKIKKKKKK